MDEDVGVGGEGRGEPGDLSVRAEGVDEGEGGDGGLLGEADVEDEGGPSLGEALGGGGGVDGLKASSVVVVVVSRTRRRLGRLAESGALSGEGDLVEGHLESVVEEEAVGERGEAEDELDALGRLNRAEDSAEHAQHASLRATRHGARRGRRLEDVAVGRAEAGRVVEDGDLALEAEDGGVHVSLAPLEADVVDEKLRLKIVGPVENDVVRVDEVRRVLPAEALAHLDDGHERVDSPQRLGRARRLRDADVRRRVDDLPLQVRHVHHVVVDDRQLTDPRRSQVHQRRRPEPARADAQDFRVLQLLLPLDAHLAQDQVPRVPLHLPAIQLGPLLRRRQRRGAAHQGDDDDGGRGH
mmetsp:Transcript_16918/g.52859  ORF Transcript_16918/g.52859 Transcript_16918/m.52859 type:complete len:354 (-) Transcript_16918:16-1077(-)